MLKQLKESDLDSAMLAHLRKIGHDLNVIHGRKFVWQNFDIVSYVRQHNLVVSLNRRGNIRGVLLYRVTRNILDPSTKMLTQDILWSKSPFATKELLLHFIDKGRQLADHTITMIGENTNIKPETLESLGFKKLETLYRMEN